MRFVLSLDETGLSETMRLWARELETEIERT